MKQYLWIPGPLPGMNDFIGKGTRFPYNTAKKRWAVAIQACIRAAKLKPVRRAYIEWRWKEPNQRRDPDNFIAIGKKFVLDALVAEGIFENDGWKQIAGFADFWDVANEAGVLVVIDENIA